MIRIIFSFTLLMSLSLSAWAKLGQEGHAGDMVVSEFVIFADEALAEFKKLNADHLPSPDFVELFEEAIEKTEVSSSEKVTLGNREVDAINFPDFESPKIIIGRNRWLDERIPYVWRRRLVIHEYLSILGFDDTRYRLSHKLTQLISAEEFKALSEAELIYFKPQGETK